MADVRLHLRLARRDAELGTPGDIARRAVALVRALERDGDRRPRWKLATVAPRQAIAEITVMVPADLVGVIDRRRGAYPRAAVLLALLRGEAGCPAAPGVRTSRRPTTSADADQSACVQSLPLPTPRPRPASPSTRSSKGMP